MRRASLFLPLIFLFLHLLHLGSAAAPPGVTTIYVKVSYNILNKVNGVEQFFSSDFYMTTLWYDARVDPSKGFQPGVDWDPTVEFVNLKGPVIKTVANPFYLADPDPAILGLEELPPGSQGHWVFLDQRYVGDFSTPLNLRDFPFDTQTVSLKVESALYDSSLLVFEPVANMSKKILPSNFEVIEWDLLGEPEVKVFENYYPVFRTSYSQLDVNLTLRRQTGYYFSKIFLGSILLVIMNSGAFVLSVKLSDRMMVSLTIFFSLITFLFISSSAMPKVSYQTQLDVFMGFSFFIVFFSLIVHAVVYLLKHAVPLRIQKPYRFDQDGREIKPLVKRFGWRWFPLHRKMDLIFLFLFNLVYAVGTGILLSGSTMKGGDKS